MEHRELYRSLPLIYYSLGDSTKVAYSIARKSPTVLSTTMAEALRICNVARTLEDHARAIYGAADVTEESRTSLLRLVEMGTLVNVNAILGRSDRVAPGHPKIDMIAVPTRARPTELERAIRGYWGNASVFGHAPSLLIADDARCDDGPESARGVSSRLAHSLSAEVSYAGPREKREFAATLARTSGISLDVVKFGLFGTGNGDICTMGGNRNSILLHAAGKNVLSVDDDTICRTARSPEHPPTQQLVFGVDGDATEFWFFQSPSEVEQFARWEEIDVIGEHERMLGGSVTDIVGKCADGLLDVVQACPHMWSMLCRGTGRVCVSYNGVAGDSAMYSGWLPHVNPSLGTRRRLASSEATFIASVQSRQVLRLAPSMTIGHADPCIGMCMGLDNSQLLPPFFPIGRNEDGLFGWMADRCVTSACAAHLPWGMMHSPPGVRCYAANAARTSRISDIVIACMSTWTSPPASKTTESALSSLGRHLIDLADLGQGGLDEFVRHGLWRMATARIQSGEAFLKKYPDLPKFWVDCIRRQNSEIRAGMLEPGFSVPSDLVRDEEAPCRVQHIILRFGELLCAWPAMIQASVRLRERGVQLGVTL